MSGRVRIDLQIGMSAEACIGEGWKEFERQVGMRLLEARRIIELSEKHGDSHARPVALLELHVRFLSGDPT